MSSVVVIHPNSLIAAVQENLPVVLVSAATLCVLVPAVMALLGLFYRCFLVVRPAPHARNLVNAIRFIVFARYSGIVASLARQAGEGGDDRQTYDALLALIGFVTVWCDTWPLPLLLSAAVALPSAWWLAPVPAEKAVVLIDTIINLTHMLALWKQ
jgi:hypothetical protein